MAPTSRGVFSNPMAGLDGLQSGIFAGPTALGMPLLDLHGLRGFGAVDVPAECWDTVGFKACHDTMLQAAQNEAASMGFAAGSEEYNAYVETEMARPDYLPTCISACKLQQGSGGSGPAPQQQTPPAQSYVPPAGTSTTTAQPPAVTGGAAGGAMSFFSSKFMGLPMYGWLAGGLMFVGIFLYLSNKKQAVAYGGGEDY